MGGFHSSAIEEGGGNYTMTSRRLHMHTKPAKRLCSTVARLRAFSFISTACLILLAPPLFRYEQLLQIPQVYHYRNNNVCIPRFTVKYFLNIGAMFLMSL